MQVILRFSIPRISKDPHHKTFNILSSNPFLPAPDKPMQLGEIERALLSFYLFAMAVFGGGLPNQVKWRNNLFMSSLALTQVDWTQLRLECFCVGVEVDPELWRLKCAYLVCIQLWTTAEHFIIPKIQWSQRFKSHPTLWIWASGHQTSSGVQPGKEFEIIWLWVLFRLGCHKSPLMHTS